MEAEAQQWVMTEDICTTDGAVGERVYGVCVHQGDREWRFADVDASPQRVEYLLRLLNEEQPASCHWEDIIRDFVDGDSC